MIKSALDISNEHQEVPCYNRCLEVVFDQPFYIMDGRAYSQLTPEEMDIQKAYEDEALQYFFNEDLPQSEAFMCDWRDEQTLWLRFIEPKATITITLRNKFTLLEGCSTPNESIHEALCLALYEGNVEAYQWLVNNVVNIHDQDT